jgi:DNA-directed RNA polymerase specialized sigma24 family protein
MQEVYATIAELPEDRRLVLVAVDVLGLSYREAAHALRVREATITTRLFRARQQVARELEPVPNEPVAHQAQVPTIRREETRAAGVLPSRGAP